VLGSLIRKDVILGGRILALNAGIFTVYFCAALFLPDLGTRAYVFLSAIICAALPLTIIGREDKLRAQALICSLPVTRRSVVLARYLEALGLGFIDVLVAILVGLVVPWSRLPAEQLLAGRTMLFAATVTAVATAFVLPFLQRFGIWGLLGLLVAGQVLGVVFMLLSSLMGRANPVRLVIRSFLAAIVTYHGHLSNAGYAAAGVAAMFGLLALSYAVACLAFEGREL